MVNLKQQKRPFPKLAIAASVVLVTVIAVFIIMLTVSAKQETEVIINEQSITFNGLYGETYPVEDIIEAKLADNMPAAGRKVNGSGFGGSKKGEWEVEGLGICRLFVQADSGPFIIMQTKDEYVIINYNDPEKTSNLYDNLSILIK